MRKRFPLENIILSIAYWLIDTLRAVASLTIDDIGRALASASRSLAPAIAFAYASGQQTRAWYERARSFVTKRFS